MMDREEILDILISILPSLEKVGVKRIGLFGSFIRNEQVKSSDVDILVEFIEGQETLSNLMKIHDLLESRIGITIDIVTMDGLSPYIGPHILEEVVFIDKASA